MANVTETNGLVLLLLASCQPSPNAYIFSFLFFLQFEFVLLWFCFGLVCFFFFNFPSWYQFNFVSFSCWKFNFTCFSHNYDNYAMMFLNVSGCSGMFHVPDFIDAPIFKELIHFKTLCLHATEYGQVFLTTQFFENYVPRTKRRVLRTNWTDLPLTTGSLGNFAGFADFAGWRHQ